MVRPVAVLHVLSVLLMLFALCMLPPFGVSFLYGDGASEAYWLSVPVTLVSGAALWGLTRHGRGELQPRDGLLLAALVWTVLPAFAALPLVLHLPQLGATDAYFET